MIKVDFSRIFSKIAGGIRRSVQNQNWENESLILQAKCLMATEHWRAIPNFSDPKWLQKKEFRVYSQFGDDGIIQYLIHILQISGARCNFIEFGVADFYESNTHFLLVNNGWSGYVMDGSKDNIRRLKNSCIYWRYTIKAQQAFIDKENINNLLAASDFDKVGVFHIDLDGNDYWILREADLERFEVDILVLEYNSTFGSEHAYTIPYDPSFNRLDAHYSGKYFGASLPALSQMAEKKGFYFVGCNSAGNNAYFLSNKHQGTVPAVSIESGFQPARFRECRDKTGELSYLKPEEENRLLDGMPVLNVSTGAIENL